MWKSPVIVKKVVRTRAIIGDHPQGTDASGEVEGSSSVDKSWDSWLHIKVSLSKRRLFWVGANPCSNGKVDLSSLQNTALRDLAFNDLPLSLSPTSAEMQEQRTGSSLTRYRHNAKLSSETNGRAAASSHGKIVQSNPITSPPHSTCLGRSRFVDLHQQRLLRAVSARELPCQSLPERAFCVRKKTHADGALRRPESVEPA